MLAGSIVFALIGNIAHKTKSYLLWDAKAERFIDNKMADHGMSITSAT